MFRFQLDGIEKIHNLTQFGEIIERGREKDKQVNITCQIGFPARYGSIKDDTFQPRPIVTR